jgi:hypothetical protein
MRSSVLIFLWPDADDEQLGDDKSEREEHDLFSGLRALRSLNFVSGCFQLGRAHIEGCRFFGPIKERCLYPNLWARFIQFEEV